MSHFCSLTWIVMLEWCVYCSNMLIHLIQRIVCGVLSNNLQLRRFSFGKSDWINEYQWTDDLVHAPLPRRLNPNRTKINSQCISTESRLNPLKIVQTSVWGDFFHWNDINSVPKMIGRNSFPRTNLRLNNTPLEKRSTPLSTPITFLLVY